MVPTRTSSDINSAADINDLQTQITSAQAEVDNLETDGININIDGGGTEIADGIVGDFVIRWDCTITGWQILGDQSGDITVDLWKCTYAQFDNSAHPVAGDSIWGTKPAISGAHKNTASGLSIALVKGQVIRVNVDSCTSIEKCHLHLDVTRT